MTGMINEENKVVGNKNTWEKLLLFLIIRIIIFYF